MRIKLAIIVGIVFVGAALESQQYGSSESQLQDGAVEGMVVDEHTAQPISHATVVAESGRGSVAKVQSAETDKEGKFVLRGLPADVYIVKAYKEQDWYPDTSLGALVSQHVESPTVKVEAGKTLTGIVIHVRKGGRIAGTVLDVRTHQPVEGLQLKLARSGDPRYWVLIDTDERGTFQKLVPTGLFELRASAPGYRDWSYGAAHSSSRGFLVRPNVSLKIDISLEPDSGS